MESREQPRAKPVDQEPSKKPRAGWAEQFCVMAEAGDDQLLDEPTPTTWDEEKWKWEDRNDQR